jgi:CO/xanthine dehydrogenase Mo-binding subunit
MLFAVTVRSSASCGKVLEISPPRLPNAYTLITAAQIPGKNLLDDMPVPILAGDRVSYIGEPVALLVGPEITKLEEYAKKCLVMVEPETPVFSPHNAPHNVYDEAAVQDGNSYAENSIYSEREYETGHTESIFASALSIVKGEYNTGIQEHWYSEAHGAVAYFTEKTLTLHTASQWVYHVRRSVSSLLNLNDSQINIEQTGIGIHFDGKLWYPSLISCQAALAAYIVKKPVKLMLTRDEDFRYSPKRNSANIKIQSALGEKGEILGTEISVTADLGGREAFAEEIIDHTCLGSLGFYKLGKVKLKAAMLKANIPPQGPMGGFGLSHGFFAVERHITHIAEHLGKNPAEWHKHNGYIKGDKLAIGIALKEPSPINGLIDMVVGMADYHRKWASYELLRQNRRLSTWSFTAEARRGIGIASAYQGSGFLHTGKDKGAYSLELTLEKDNSLKIKTSLPPQGKDQSNLWKSIASGILDLDSAKIVIISGAVDSGPASLSRSISTLVPLLEKCCETLRRKRVKDPPPITVKCNVKPEKVKIWDIENKNEDKGADKSEDKNAEKYADQCAFYRPGWASSVVEAEIDPISFFPIIRGIWLAVDGGKILSPDHAKRVIRIAAIHALGLAEREFIHYQEGLIPSSVIHNYDIPSPEDIPPIYVEFMDNGSKIPKGIGDLPFSCIPAAYAQAVSQAMDHHFEKIPISIKDIWEAGQLKLAENRAEKEAGEGKAAT